MLAALVDVARLLWRNSPPWRWTTIGAGVLTLLSLIGWLGTPPPDNSKVVTPTPTPTPLVIPTPTPATQSLSGLLNPVAPVDQRATARLGNFYKQANSAEQNIQAEGERCEQLKSFLESLSPGDSKQASAAQKDMIDKAENCREQIRQSDQNWAELARLGMATQKNPSLANTQEFVRAATVMDTFDRSRSAAVKQNWLGIASAYEQDLTTYAREMETLVPLAALYLPEDPATLKITEDLAATYQRIGALKVHPTEQEYDGNQQAAIKSAKHAIQFLKASDDRLQALVQAWNRRAETPIALIYGVSALTDFDRARWDVQTNRPAALPEIEKQAANGLGKALTDTLSAYDRQKSRALANRVVELRTQADRRKAPLSQEVVSRSDQVVAEVQASKARLRELGEAVQAWEHYRNSGRTRDTHIEERMAKAYKGLTQGGSRPQPFDIEDINDEERQALEKAVLAMATISGRVESGQQGIPVVLDLKELSNDRVVAPVAELITKQLMKRGFKIVDQPNAALFRLVVTNPHLTGSYIDSASGETAYTMSVTANITWLYNGMKVDLGKMSAEGMSRDTSLALSETYEKVSVTVTQKLLTGLQSGK